jgi:hypothetical protein
MQPGMMVTACPMQLQLASVLSLMVKGLPSLQAVFGYKQLPSFTVAKQL